MGYLITHIAAYLVFAQLLGLLLGWLLWGYPAREHAKEVRSLREQIASLQMSTPRVMQPKPKFSLAPGVDPSENTQSGANGGWRSSQVGNDPVGNSFQPDALVHVDTVAAAPAYVAPDLDAEVKEARLYHLQQQVRELESTRDHLPLLEAALSDAIAGRRAAEQQIEELQEGFEVRLSSLLSQIQNFESAAQEWNHLREEFERTLAAKDKELVAVGAHLRDLQNNQLPQKVELPQMADLPQRFEAPVLPGISALEVADLRERHQKAVTERDSMAAELQQFKHSEGSRYQDSERLAQLEETLRSKDAILAEQSAQVESLLWRAAELEPFADALPRLEEELRRRQAVIAGHEAMQAETSVHIRTLLNRVAELESAIEKAAEWDKTHAEREVALRKALSDGQVALQAAISGRDAERQRTAELGRLVERKDAELHTQSAAHVQRENYISELEARISSLELLPAQILELEQAGRRHDAEIQRLGAALSDKEEQLNRMTQGHESRLAELHQVLDGKVLEIQGHEAVRAELENMLTSKDLEIHRVSAANIDKDAQLTSLNERLSALDEALASARQKLAWQEEQSRSQLKTQLESLQARHQFELARVRATLAQRLRRVSQGL